MKQKKILILICIYILIPDNAYSRPFERIGNAIGEIRDRRIENMEHYHKKRSDYFDNKKSKIRVVNRFFHKRAYEHGKKADFQKARKEIYKVNPGKKRMALRAIVFGGRTIEKRIGVVSNKKSRLGKRLDYCKNKAGKAKNPITKAYYTIKSNNISRRVDKLKDKKENLKGNPLYVAYDLIVDPPKENGLLEKAANVIDVIDPVGIVSPRGIVKEKVTDTVQECIKGYKLYKKSKDIKITKRAEKASKKWDSSINRKISRANLWKGILSKRRERIKNKETKGPLLNTFKKIRLAFLDKRINYLDKKSSKLYSIKSSTIERKVTKKLTDQVVGDITDSLKPF